MFHTILSKLDRIFPVEKASAHCDIPCGIYDPHHAQLGALTVIRMIDMMNDLATGPEKDTLEYHNSVTRFITVKEEHAELVKREARVIYGDYFKQEHIDKYPELPGLIRKIHQLASKGRQTTSRESAMELLQAVNRFAEIFWETKGIATKRVVAPYKPSEEVVYPVL